MIPPALAVYRLAAAALAPVAAWKLRRAVAGDSGLLERQRERHGDVSQGGGELWLHAASVGEVNAAAVLVGALLARDESLRLVISTVTHTGALEVARRFGDEARVRHLFAPLDTPGRVRRWLERSKPAALVLVETEIWPELLAQCRERGMPVAMVSARLSDKAFRRYRRFASLFGQALDGVDLVLCQTGQDLNRFGVLGVPDQRLAVTGNLKLDCAGLPPPTEQVCRWRDAFAGRRVWVAGSTHQGEEEILAPAQRKVQSAVGDALLVVVPRHPERAPAALRALEASGVSCCEIDRLADVPSAAAVVVDRIGVLTGLYQLAELCVVCGSLVPGTGGHNLIEPALAGKPVITGRWTESQEEMADGLSRAGALVRVEDADTLAGEVIRLLRQPEQARALSERARAFSESQRGAISATMEALAGWLSVESPA